MEKEEKEEQGEGDESILNMRETIEILELKVKKLDHMMKIKENKIESLTKRLADAGLY